MLKRVVEAGGHVAGDALAVLHDPPGGSVDVRRTGKPCHVGELGPDQLRSKAFAPIERNHPADHDLLREQLMGIVPGPGFQLVQRPGEGPVSFLCLLHPPGK